MGTRSDQIVVDEGVKVPMRDGTLLDAMVWRPAAPGRYPALVERVAYEQSWRSRANGELYAQHGYAVVAQNVRGTFASGGRYSHLRDDGWGANQDGYDTIEWVAQQPWSNGRVGMIDGSYSGRTQYLVAPTRPPHLRALFVRQTTGDLYDMSFPGGTHSLAYLRDFVVHSYLLPQLGRRGALAGEAPRVRVEQVAAEMDRWLRHLPLKSWPPIEGLADWYWEILDHPDDGPYWWATSLSRVVDEVDTPILHLTGWFDPARSGNLGAFAGIRARGRSAACRAAQRLIVGPWLHGAEHIGQCQVGEIDFGPEAVFDLHAWRLRWYDHWLKCIGNGAMDGPPVRLFLMGRNRWLGLSDWPPADVTCRPLYLASGAEPGRGGLAFTPPAMHDPPDSFRYDPDDPVPSLVLGLERPPTDHRPIEHRVLTYTSPPLEEDLHVVGPVKAVLYGASSAPDTDWVARLCDVWPDGRSIALCEGILRARYRDSFERPTPMEPGEVYRFEVDLTATAQTFLAGHQLRVHVTSSDFPRYDRNLNTGGPFGEESSGQVATNTVFHDASRPSHILLPVMSEPSVEAALI